ncbi:MAG: hypothetical protein HND56_00630 [Pseudomonadota bacterium]|nr:hypothetical protein [Pseudomonadota bacterium]QKK04274.1 MAG: hypothetical protein HND56_00630 [Pseudomonadota bacterium]|tara:strand:+ start:1006 stop:1275 length:270 start_codon:yes stop_codon:yes gene_type:complete
MDKPQEPVTYKRKYADGEEVSFVDLREAYRTAASLVADLGDNYLPVFQRLEQELQERQQKEAVKARALEVARKERQKNTTGLPPHLTKS